MVKSVRRKSSRKSKSIIRTKSKSIRRKTTRRPTKSKRKRKVSRKSSSKKRRSKRRRSKRKVMKGGDNCKYFSIGVQEDDPYNNSFVIFKIDNGFIVSHDDNVATIITGNKNNMNEITKITYNERIITESEKLMICYNDEGSKTGIHITSQNTQGTSAVIEGLDDN